MKEKVTNRERILSEGLKVMQERGYAGTSVRDIIQAAGVPQGSFTNHFASKEDFGIEVLDAYYSQCEALSSQTLLDETSPPLARLKKWIDGMLETLNADGKWDGCLLGNFGADHSEGTARLQEHVRGVFLDLQGKLEFCIRAAVKAGELPRSTDPKALANFIHSSLEGSVLTAKALRSRAPMDSFRIILFASILRKQPSR